MKNAETKVACGALRRFLPSSFFLLPSAFNLEPPVGLAPSTCARPQNESAKLVLWLRHRGKMASTAGIAPATSTFPRWRSDLTELRGHLALGHLPSVAGLAPALKEMQKAE